MRRRDRRKGMVSRNLNQRPLIRLQRTCVLLETAVCLTTVPTMRVVRSLQHSAGRHQNLCIQDS